MERLVVLLGAVALCRSHILDNGVKTTSNTSDGVSDRKKMSTLLKPVLEVGISGPGQELTDEEEDIQLAAYRIAAGLEEMALQPTTALDQNTWQGRGRKRKTKKGEVQFLMKAIMGLKVALLGIILPFGVIAAKVLSWKAVTLSLMAFMLAKIVFVKNLFMSKSSSTSAPAPPATPIVIHSSAPSHDHVWKRQSDPQIHVKPEVHLHQSEEQFHTYEEPHQHSSKDWGWGESRARRDPHDIVFRSWAPKVH